jgi:hypothetical protein
MIVESLHRKSRRTERKQCFEKKWMFELSHEGSLGHTLTLIEALSCFDAKSGQAL